MSEETNKQANNETNKQAAEKAALASDAPKTDKPAPKAEQPAEKAAPTSDAPKAEEAAPKKEEAKPAELDRSFPDVVAGAFVKVHQEITDITPKGEEKKRIQVFEGIVLGRKHGKGINATITVRKESGGVGVEKIFPLSLPTVKKIEVVKAYKTRRAKIGYIRDKHKKLQEIRD
jgi:large subunit ribosomal protein L19